MDFELSSTNVHINGISKEDISKYIAMTDEGRVVSVAHLPIFKDGKLTVLGALLFCSNPKKHIKSAYTKVLVYADNIGTLIKSTVINGSILKQYKQVCTYLADYSHTSYCGVLPYDTDLLHRSIASGLVNKDYQADEPLVLSVFPTNIVVSYPKSSNPYHTSINPTLKGIVEKAGIDCSGKDNGSTNIEAHVDFIKYYAVQCASYLWSTNKKREAVNFLKSIVHKYNVTPIVTQLLDYAYLLDDPQTMIRILNDYTHNSVERSIQPYVVSARFFIKSGNTAQAKKVLGNIPDPVSLNELLIVTRIRRKLRDFSTAHTLLVRYIGQYGSDPKFVHELALVKKLHGIKTGKNKFLYEAEVLLNTINTHSDKNIRGWAWFDLSKVYEVIKPEKATEALEEAVRACPYEKSFKG